jgi:RNA polymerase sigma-70 factor (ECF subfamily)
VATTPDEDRQRLLAELVAAAQGGEREAFDELVRQTYVEVYTLAVRLTANEEDASDVVQEAYLRAWKGIRRFRGDAQFSTWMYRITANAAATNVRRRRRQQADPFEDDLEPADPRTDLQPAAMAESAEAMERISDALDELPPKLRSVVVLKDVYDLSHEAIADELGITVAAAKVRLHRGRRKLRDALYEEGAEAHAV